jgi:hypothetical protein
MNKKYDNKNIIIIASRAYFLHFYLTSPATAPEKSLMSTHASVLVDSVGPPSAEVCRIAASFP